MTTASAPIACSVSAVSLSDSPLDTLDPLAEKLMTSADSRLAAVSNEMRVRVESSKKRLTTVRPRSVGSFLISRPCVAAIEPAVSRIRTASAQAEVGRGQQVLHRTPPSMSTASRPSLSCSRTRTRSVVEVGRFLPT